MQPEEARGAHAARERRVPASTYRLQFHRGFGFSDAQALVPYLAALGVTACYASPYLKASPGSTHGYDICDHNQLNPEIGSEQAYAAFTSALAAHGLGQIVDFVPNHMGIDAGSNTWWRDVLENGPCSPFAPYFDIDWHPVKPELDEKILLPILGDQYGLVLERGELQLLWEDGALRLRYFDHNLPINPRQYPHVLEHDLDALRRDLGDDEPHLVEYLSVITALHNLPVYTETEPPRIAERHREKEVARERLQRVVDASARLHRHIEQAVHAFNGVAGKPASFDQLHRLLEAQPYRLSYWRTASHEINYRRFFDINQLAGLRMEEPAVFAATHALLLRLIGEGKVTGIRLDHIDGLFDPTQYLERLQDAVCKQLGRSARRDPNALPLYVVAEKILSSGESLPAHWPIAGTSGYDFLNDLNGLFIDGGNRKVLERVYRRFTGIRRSFADIAYQSKKLIMDSPMASELNVLAHELNRLSERDRRTRDFTLNSLREALREVVACFPIYRTYVSAAGCTEADRDAISIAIRRARQRNPTIEPSIFAFLRSMLLPEVLGQPASDDQRLRLRFAMKFQQYTGPVQAKGIEDTAFYRYNLLASLNAVGGDPERFGRSPSEFHAANHERRAQWPYAMLASTTHDTKRGEDVRARLNVLSEIPEEWGHHLSAWARINAGNRTVVDGQPAPDRNAAYLFYQSLLGVWPPDGSTTDSEVDETLRTRLRDYMLKAVREAKVHTSWITQNQAYEDAVARFVERTLTGPTAVRFLKSFVPFAQRIAQFGMINSLSQLVLKVVSPGVPDFYQGTELWDLSLVDPDNRRPVDYATRQRLLNDLESVLTASDGDAGKRTAAVREMLAHWQDGRIKLFLAATLLRLRRQQAALFLDGTYEPLDAQGEQALHVVAVRRCFRKQTLIAVVPRLVTQVAGPTQSLPLGAESWSTTWLPLPSDQSFAAYRNAITGERLGVEDNRGGKGLRVASILSTCPAALLLGSH